MKLCANDLCALCIDYLCGCVSTYNHKQLKVALLCNFATLQYTFLKIQYGRKFWRGIYFGGLAVLRAIRQYFFCQNLCNHIVFLLNKPGCARLIDLSSAWSSQLTAARGHYVFKEFAHRRWKKSARKSYAI